MVHIGKSTIGQSPESSVHRFSNNFDYAPIVQNAATIVENIPVKSSSSFCFLMVLASNTTVPPAYAINATVRKVISAIVRRHSAIEKCSWQVGPAHTFTLPLTHHSICSEPASANITDRPTIAELVSLLYCFSDCRLRNKTLSFRFATVFSTKLCNCQGRSKTRPLGRSKSRPLFAWIKFLSIRGRRASGA